MGKIATRFYRNIDVVLSYTYAMTDAREPLVPWDPGHPHRLTHDLFRFPGKFHPPLIQGILSKLDPSFVADPMAGVGTVAVEAKSLGIPSLSIDIDPLSVFFAKVKTTPIEPDVLQEAWSALKPTITDWARPEAEIQDRMFEDLTDGWTRRVLREHQVSHWSELSHWFRNYTLVDYARVDYLIRNGGIEDYRQSVRDFFLACLLAGVRRFSLADPSPVSGLEITKTMREKIEDGYPIDVHREFARRVEDGIEQMREYNKFLEKKGAKDTSTYVRKARATHLPSISDRFEANLDLVLFSPPYCNAIEYWRRHRLEYVLGRFLEVDDIPDLHREFVGRRVVGGKTEEPKPVGYGPLDDVLSGLYQEGREEDNHRKKKKSHLLWQYFDEMDGVLNAARDALGGDGHCVVVVGNSTTYERKVPTADALAHLGENAGFGLASRYVYDIKNRSMQFPTESNGKIDSEHLLVFRK